MVLLVVLRCKRKIQTKNFLTFGVTEYELTLLQFILVLCILVHFSFLHNQDRFTM